MENEDEMEMIDVKVIPVTNERSPFVAEAGAGATDGGIEEFFRHRTWKYTLLVLSLMVTWLGGPTIVYLTAFAGMRQCLEYIRKALWALCARKDMFFNMFEITQ